jgi:hypothetical protein
MMSHETDAPRIQTWTPRYSGPLCCGICVCTHHYSDHHLGIVMNQEYLDQTGESYIAQECEWYGCNQEGGLDDAGNLHCGHYVDAGPSLIGPRP